MSADTRKTDAALRIALLCGLLGGAFAVADEDPPELELLDYLGSWEGSEADWVMFSDQAAEQATKEDERSDPAPEGEESPETEDES